MRSGFEEIEVKRVVKLLQQKLVELNVKNRGTTGWAIMFNDLHGLANELGMGLVGNEKTDNFELIIK